VEAIGNYFIKTGGQYMYTRLSWLKLELLNQLICDAFGPLIRGISQLQCCSGVLPKLHRVDIE
jgi:hypothetical protein